MYSVITLEDVVRVPPDRFGNPLKETVMELLREKWQGIISRDLGIIVSILDVKEIGVGKIIMGDGGVYHKVVFDALAFKPELHEILEGEVVDVIDRGVFVRLGPIDGFVHISQVMDDYLVHDASRGALIGRDTSKVVERNDIVRVRVVSVSWAGPKLKIGLTMRQPGLGPIKYLVKEEEKGEAKSV